MADNIQNFDDKNIICDIIVNEKFITDKYNLCAIECTTAKVKNIFVNILDEKHSILYDLTNESIKRGWCTNCTASQDKIDTIKQKFAKL